MRINTTVRIKRRIVDAATGRVVKESPWQKNLVMNQGLNGLAQQTSAGLQTGPNGLNTWLLVGSGTTPNQFASGAVTFTQSGTTITASAGFFTAGMVGMLFKWGTGSSGAEYYITAFGSSTSVTVDTSATVSTPDVATVWNVAQTTLATFLFKSNTCQTNPGDNGVTNTGNSITFKRTLIIPQQVASYNVNEIGYAPASTAGNLVSGRIVLGSTDVVGTSNYYVVVIQVTYTLTPGTPTAVSNVGTNIDTSGNAMVEYFSMGGINSSGASTSGTADILNAANQGKLMFATATYSQLSNISATASLQWTSPVSISGQVTMTYVASSIGKARWTFTAGTASTTGQTCYGMAIYSNNGGTFPIFDIKFTTPQTLPNGTLQPQTVIEITFGRTLTN